MRAFFGPLASPASLSASLSASRSGLAVAVLAVTGLAGCPAKVVSLEIAPPKVELRQDTASKKLTVTKKAEDGTAVEDDEKTVTWASADPAIATVDANGTVKPAGSGKTKVTATLDTISASVPVEVLLLKRLQLPAPAMVVTAGVPSEALAVQFLNEKGEPVTPDAKDAVVSWASADAAVATVTPQGVVQGVAAGSTMITATAGELKAEINLTVNPAPAPVDGAPAPTTPRFASARG